MELRGDELAGVADLFGGLTRDELGRALVELAYKRGEDCEPDAFAEDVTAALSSYHLVAFEPPDRDEPLLVPGPVAFPALPEGATDLPHIMDVPDRPIDRDAVGVAAAERLRSEADGAIARGDADRIAELLDVSYEFEAWAPVDLGVAREQLDDAL
jgi:hypothetical protein